MRVVAVLVLVLALSGCFGKGPSQADMREEVEAAIKAFPDDVSPSGTLSSIEVSGDLGIETEFNGAPVTVTIQPEMTVTLGSAGDVLVEGKALTMRFTAYCSADRLIAITSGGEQYDVPDTSAEARNPLDVCTGRGSEGILLEYFEFEFIDPAILTGDLRLEEMEEQGFEKVGKGRYAGTYLVEGAEGTTTLTITVKDAKITKMISQNPNSHLSLDMTYGERSPITPPEADHRVPSRIQGTAVKDENGWTWTGDTIEGGPVDEYSLNVYPQGTTVGCTTNEQPVVSFHLGEGADQDKDGWQMLLFEDGDGTLGAGDQIIIKEPGFGKEFSHVVAFNDEWAGQKPTYTCSVPAPGVAVSLVGLLAIIVARRF